MASSILQLLLFCIFVTEQIEMSACSYPSYFLVVEVSEVLAVFAYTLCLQMACVWVILLWKLFVGMKTMCFWVKVCLLFFSFPKTCLSSTCFIPWGSLVIWQLDSFLIFVLLKAVLQCWHLQNCVVSVAWKHEPIGDYTCMRWNPLLHWSQTGFLP